MKTQAEMMALVPQKLKEIEEIYGVEVYGQWSPVVVPGDLPRRIAILMCALSTNAKPKIILN